MNKEALREAVVARLESDLAILVAAANSSRSEATDEESRSEGKYDMRGQTAAYLASGQAMLATELGEAISAYRLMRLSDAVPGGIVSVGSLVKVESGTRQTHYFLGPARGGMEVSQDDFSATVITAVSPIGRRLMGKRVGDRFWIGAGERGPAQTVIAIA